MRLNGPPPGDDGARASDPRGWQKKPAADPLPGREPYDAGGREAANALLTTSITWSAV